MEDEVLEVKKKEIYDIIEKIDDEGSLDYLKTYIVVALKIWN